MKNVSQAVSINTTYTRSINLERDVNASEFIDTYILTSCSNQCLRKINDACSQSKATNKAWSLIGPYGSGKSSFALFLSHLLSNLGSKTTKSAWNKLEKHGQGKNKKLKSHLARSEGYCRILLSGSPEPLIPTMLASIKLGVNDYFKSISKTCREETRAINRLINKKDAGVTEVINLLDTLQKKVEKTDGKGLLIIIDELGKFLEYEARHDRGDIFLLQALAEHTYKKDILFLVLLHQSLDQYCKNLGDRQRNEWLKIQGRFGSIPFVETTEQTIHIMSQVFKQNPSVKQNSAIKKDIKRVTHQLHNHSALPHALKEKQAERLFLECYPLHPITLLLLPILCQKVAQNERTLFNYMGSNEKHGLISRMNQTKLGEFVYPDSIYDYFISNQQIYTNDIQTQRRWAEAVTAIERLSDTTESEVKLLKAIGLLNITGTHGGLRATDTILSECLKDAREAKKSLKNLLRKSAITHRKFNNEYRVWQGSDFDLERALQSELTRSTTVDVAEAINQNHFLTPVVARRYSIEKHSMFYFQPVFINASDYKKKIKGQGSPRIIFCLSENKEEKKLVKEKIVDCFSEKGSHDICVLCNNTEQIKPAVLRRIALEKVGASPEVGQDPVIQREYRDYYLSALDQEQEQIMQLFERPQNHQWYVGGKAKKIKSRRKIQEMMSELLETIYCKAPLISNELINRDKPSGQANLARKKMLLALLENRDKEDLAIEKSPAEKSMYRAIIKESGIHRKNRYGKWGIAKPTKNDKLNFLPAWEKIEKLLNNTKDRNRSFCELDEILSSSPYGIKKGVLPILYMLVYLSRQDEIEVYEDRLYIPYFTPDHLERFLKRPSSFSFRLFEIEGIKQRLLSEYEREIFNNERRKNILSLFKPLGKFIADIPEYTKQTKNISSTARKVRDSFKYAQSPQKLLFEVLPQACGFTAKRTKGFGEKLKMALREIQNAYPEMLEREINAIKKILDLKQADKLNKVRIRAMEYCEPLKQYTIDEKLVKFIDNIMMDARNDDLWIERLLAFIIGKPTKHWTDNEAIYVQNKINEYGRELNELSKLRAYSHGHKLRQSAGRSFLISVRDMTGKSLDKFVFLEDDMTEEQKINYILDSYRGLAKKLISSEDKETNLENVEMITKIVKSE